MPMFAFTWAVVFTAFLIALLLVLKFVANLRWSTAICLLVLVISLASIFGVRALGPTLMYGPFFFLPGLICAIILCIQFFSWAVSSDYGSVNTAERAKILQMVEDGKISSDEGSELLDAMGRSTALRGQEKFSRLDIVMLVGTALVILGFFLPWAYLGRGMYQAGHQRGPIGWTVLIVAVLSAVPIFITPKDFLYKISMLQIFLILVGLALMIKELAVGADQAGSIFCLAGFIIELIASVAKFKRLAA